MSSSAPAQYSENFEDLKDWILHNDLSTDQLADSKALFLWKPKFTEKDLKDALIYAIDTALAKQKEWRNLVSIANKQYPDAGVDRAFWEQVKPDQLKLPEVELKFPAGDYIKFVRELDMKEDEFEEEPNLDKNVGDRFKVRSSIAALARWIKISDGLVLVLRRKVGDAQQKAEDEGRPN